MLIRQEVGQTKPHSIHPDSTLTAAETHQPLAMQRQVVMNSLEEITVFEV